MKKKILRILKSLLVPFALLLQQDVQIVISCRIFVCPSSRCYTIYLQSSESHALKKYKIYMHSCTKNERNTNCKNWKNWTKKKRFTKKSLDYHNIVRQNCAIIYSSGSGCCSFHYLRTQGNGHCRSDDGIVFILGLGFLNDIINRE